VRNEEHGVARRNLNLVISQVADVMIQFSGSTVDLKTVDQGRCNSLR